MKRSWLVVVVGLLLFALSGCSEEPKPEEAFESYISQWNEQEFEKMYEQLSTESKENISKDDFVERYDTIYEDIEVNNLKVDFTKPEEEVTPDDEGIVELPFSVSMDTIAGPISFDHKATLQLEGEEDNQDWTINWDTSFIFKQLKEGDEVTLKSDVPTRGQLFDRDANGLAINGKVRWIGVVPEQMGEEEQLILEELSEVINISQDDIREKLQQGWVKNDPTQFVPIKGVIGEVDPRLEEIASVMTMEKTERVYPLGEKAAHVTGYIRQMYEEEAEEFTKKGYSSYEYIGAARLRASI
ncbi:NTF2-like N-terminal transpeptidase domain-containing protein [Bacillus carboniphilus]|uniref:serine-type D-Ala-D-Ala carboxypeptidase n=1 Tax=Bacillus carboniphilus TaxID=86663 RepID=A0ABY9JT71_9BACI|nr:NTF2-like N-terminal transpeptidase domain-containing protein [Bacillus carboniphilus]WLR42537.1 NTF2-like N-terminal transpeptidase domain-containing protein [Bacillus carboniphilus]